MRQKGFIQIPLLIVIIVSVVVASVVTTGVVLHRQGKLSFLVANISQVFRETEDTESEVKSKEHQLIKEQSQSEEINLEKVSQIEQELERQKIEVEKFKAEAKLAEIERRQLEEEKAKWNYYTNEGIPGLFKSIDAVESMKRKIVNERGEQQSWLDEVYKAGHINNLDITPLIDACKEYVLALDEALFSANELIEIRNSLINAINNRDEYLVNVLIAKEDFKADNFMSLFETSQKIAEKVNIIRETSIRTHNR